MKITDFAKGLTIVATCVMLGGTGDGFAATYNCNAQAIPKTIWDMNRDKNQFLYSNNVNHQRHYGWACGHKQIDGCKTAVLLLMPAGHYWQDEVRTEIEFYSCNSTGAGSRWETVGATGGGYISQCTSSQMTSWKNNHVQYGMTHYFCEKMVDNVCVDETRTSNASQTNGICRATDDQYRCVNNGGKWNDSTSRCDCTKSGEEWDANQHKCVKSRKQETQECYNRNGVPDSGGACRCKDTDWYDPNFPNSKAVGGKGLCRPQSQCPKTQGMVCPPTQVFNIDNSNTNNVNVGQQQQQGQTSDNSNNNSNTNYNENNNSNENHNNSHNGNGGSNSTLQECLTNPARQGKPELIACCYLPKTGVNGAKADFTTGKCVCNDASKKFSIQNGRGVCTGTGGGGNGNDDHGHGDHITAQCPNNMYYNGTEKRCMCSERYQTEINNNTGCKCAIPDTYNNADGECVCNDPKKTIVEDSNGNGMCVWANQQCVGEGMEFDAASGECVCTIPDATTNNGRCKCIDKNKVVKGGVCVVDDAAIERIRGNIKASYSKLSSSMGGFEKSVWKDAEGNFNTARLASDSIAGVVLGTAGGIITSKLVKKNQIKKGFEDIKCSIGGQNVASFGDTFTVGM